jgi:hypothetical protein
VETIIGLGNAGCNIAEKFMQYPQYNVYRIDAEKRKGPKFKKVPECSSHEEYEASCPSMKRFFKDAKPPYLFIVSGGSTISGASLRILQQLDSKEINILYIKPDISLLPHVKQLEERVVFNVLQEYTRSAVFKKIFIVSNAQLEEVLGEVPIVGYYDKLNDILVNTTHMINVFNNTKPVMGTLSETLEVARISTLGLVDIETGEKKLFYPLQTPREMLYYYSIDHEQLENDGTLLRKFVKQVKDSSRPDTRVSYGIYSNNYKQNYGYIVLFASSIQKTKGEENEL